MMRRMPMRAQHVFLFSALALSAASCVDNDTSLYVEGVLHVAPPGCEVSADPTSTRILRGTLDVAFLRSYVANVLVANQLTPRGSKAQLRTETMGVEIRGAEIVLTNAEGAVLEEFSVPSGGFVHASEGEAPGYGSALVTLIPPSRGQALFDQLSSGSRGDARTVIANVRVFGDTLGGIEVTSGEFTYPIDVCLGCLIDFPLEAIEDTGAGRICGGAADSVTTTQCIRGQDATIDCRTCATTLQLCAQLD